VAPELASLVDPGHTALLTMEVQEGVLGEKSPLPELARAARDAGITGRIGELCRAARAAGVPVVHCTAEARADGRGANHNARLFGALRRSAPTLLTGSAAARVHPEVGVEDSDFVLSRLHGISPLTGTEVDPILRNLGVSTIVGTGVSVNVGILGLAFEAVNLGYQLVLPRDATAGVGEDYVGAVYANTLSLLATVTTTAAVIEAWNQAARC